jgi:hypothetical protein
MSGGSSGPDSEAPGWADLEPTRTVAGGRPRADGAAQPAASVADGGTVSAAPTAASVAAETVVPRTATEVVRHGPGLTASAGQHLTASAGQDLTVTTGQGQAGSAARPAEAGARPAGLVRHGPGVPAVPPAGRAGLTAEHVWRDTRPARPSRRAARLRRLTGLALTAALLAASGVLLYLRFHHAPFQVTGAAITGQAPNGCGVDVTGQVTTNGSAGTVSYQWLFTPGTQAPQPLRQSVAAGQRTVDVTVAVEGQGQGSASQRVTLQVLGPDPASASATVTVSCP